MGGERINSGLNLWSLSFHCSLFRESFSFKKQTIFMLFSRFPWVFVCVRAKQMLTSPSPHFWPTTSSFLPLEALQSPPTESGTQHMWTTHGSLTPLCCLAKVQGCIDVITIKQRQSHNLRCSCCLSFINFPDGRVKQRWHMAFLMIL